MNLTILRRLDSLTYQSSALHTALKERLILIQESLKELEPLLIVIEEYSSMPDDIEKNEVADLNKKYQALSKKAHLVTKSLKKCNPKRQKAIENSNYFHSNEK